MILFVRRMVLWKRLAILTIIFTTVLLVTSFKMHTVLSEVKVMSKLQKLNTIIPLQETFNQTVQNVEIHVSFEMEAFRENKARIRKIAEVCSKYKLGNYKHVNTNTSSTFTIKYPPTPQYSVFYYDLEDSFAFCPIYKAASSTWLYNLCLLAGESEESLQNTKQQLSSIARRFFPEIIDFEIAQEATPDNTTLAGYQTINLFDPAFLTTRLVIFVASSSVNLLSTNDTKNLKKYVLEKCTKLIVVRHPFERILSAYRDKLENINTGWEHGTGHFYRKYGAKIVRKYRPGGNKSVAVLKPGTYIWEKQKPRPAGIEPTFKEFVSYLLDTDLLNYADDHWIPYNLFCTPCFVNYDFVAKVETLSRDQLFIINKLGWIKRIQPRWRHKTGEEKSKEFIARAYFSQLSQQEVQLLYDKYRLDFEMFDYSPNLYISYAKDDN